MATFVTWNATASRHWTGVYSSNHTVNASLGIPEAVETFVLPCLLSFTVVLGIVGNSISLWHITRLKKVSSATDVLLLDLTIANVLVILASIFILIHLIPACNFMKPLLDAQLLIGLVNLYGSPLFMSCIAIDQYIAVAHPIRSHAWRRPRYYVALSIVAWLAVLSLSLPAFHFNRNVVDEILSCEDKIITRKSWQIFLLFCEIISFVIPVLVLLLCYALTIKKLIKVGAGKESMELMKTKVRRNISGILALLLLCFAPFHIAELYFMSAVLIDPLNRMSAFYPCHVKIYTWALTSFSAFLSPMLYVFRSQNFQWRAHCCVV
ncbi:somatostatin receptor type 5-like [Scyliorhinus canicula]|uniref:somatostatin receptor type 5-like n=1 Tax=Scyliorhinus canicula TaxID=7830 RepID=UPI0018F3F746|nr:somatostatin receptor type 5-like [Scyliorhinus canicula]